MTTLAAWQNFYVIVGSSAGALIGLQFVVLSLISSRPAGRTNAQAGQAFATPTIVHFATVLVLAALMSAPWHGIEGVTVLWGAGGAGGLGYTIVVIRRMRRQTAYKPEFEDWLFHVVLPLLAYLILVVSAFGAGFYLHEALFGVGASVLLLLLVGIHNAWDGVTYHVFVVRNKDSERPH
jgi:hypothetical protein